MRRRSDHGLGHGPGQGVDYAGNPVIDPTENVKALTEQAIARVDDMAGLRGELLDEKIRRMEREWIHLDLMGQERERHSREMRDSESRRVDANRATDLAAVQTAAVQANTAIQTLAKQTTDLAATLDKKVTDTAVAADARNTAQYSDTNKRLSALELTYSEGKGKQTVTDPAYDKLVDRMDHLLESRDKGAGKSEAFSASWGILLSVAGLALTLLLIASMGVGVTIFLATRPAAAVAPPAYLNAPPGTMLPSPPTTVPR